MLPPTRNGEPPQVGKPPDEIAVPQTAVSQEPGAGKSAPGITRKLNAKKFTSNTGRVPVVQTRSGTGSGGKSESGGKALDLTGRKSRLAAGKFSSGQGKKTISETFKKQKNFGKDTLAEIQVF